MLFFITTFLRSYVNSVKFPLGLNGGNNATTCKKRKLEQKISKNIRFLVWSSEYCVGYKNLHIEELQQILILQIFPNKTEIS